MSRIGNAPVPLPEKVEVAISAAEISVKGPLGTMTQRLTPEVKVEKVENRIQFKAAGNSRHANAMFSSDASATARDVGRDMARITGILARAAF